MASMLIRCFTAFRLPACWRANSADLASGHWGEPILQASKKVWIVELEALDHFRLAVIGVERPIRWYEDVLGFKRPLRGCHRRLIRLDPFGQSHRNTSLLIRVGCDAPR